MQLCNMWYVLLNCECFLSISTQWWVKTCVFSFWCCHKWWHPFGKIWSGKFVLSEHARPHAEWNQYFLFPNFGVKMKGESLIGVYIFPICVCSNCWTTAQEEKRKFRIQAKQKRQLKSLIRRTWLRFYGCVGLEQYGAMFLFSPFLRDTHSCHDGLRICVNMREMWLS